MSALNEKLGPNKLFTEKLEKFELERGIKFQSRVLDQYKNKLFLLQNVPTPSQKFFRATTNVTTQAF